MKIICCYKYVPDDQDFMVMADRTLDMSRAEWKIGSYDLNAVEAAMTLVESDASGGNSDAGNIVQSEIIALTTALEHLDNTKLQKAILSRGPDQMIGIAAERDVSSDSLMTAKLLAAGILKIGDVDLVLCGEGSSDIYAQQVGPMIGALLGWPALNAVRAIKRQGEKLVVERETKDAIEVIEVCLPAVISVTSDSNKPRIPGMRDILGAGKKPCTIWDAKSLEVLDTANTKVVSCLAPEQKDRLGIIFEDTSDESVDAFVDYLKKAM